MTIADSRLTHSEAPTLTLEEEALAVVGGGLGHAQEDQAHEEGGQGHPTSTAPTPCSLFLAWHH